jgi:hypothetical protein
MIMKRKESACGLASQWSWKQVKASKAMKVATMISMPYALRVLNSSDVVNARRIAKNATTPFRPNAEWIAAMMSSDSHSCAVHGRVGVWNREDVLFRYRESPDDEVPGANVIAGVAVAEEPRPVDEEKQEQDHDEEDVGDRWEQIVDGEAALCRHFPPGWPAAGNNVCCTFTGGRRSKGAAC